jgi:hypothetical protein
MDESKESLSSHIEKIFNSEIIPRIKGNIIFVKKIIRGIRSFIFLVLSYFPGGP